MERLEERCRFAESRALQAEMRLTKVMIQIYRDSPKLTTCLLLSNKQTPAIPRSGENIEPKDELIFYQKSQESEERQPDGRPEKVSTLLVTNNLARTTGDRLSPSLIRQHDGGEQFNSGGDCKAQESDPELSGPQAMLEKLAIELWKTKKQLFAVLQEKKSAKNNLPLLEVQEYEAIINQLQQDLLLLRCQYTEIRQALQSQHPGDILHTIGQLQDKARKQEKIISQQQSLILSQQASNVPMRVNEAQRSCKSQRIVEGNSEMLTSVEGQHNSVPEGMDKADRSLGFSRTVENHITLRPVDTDINQSSSTFTDNGQTPVSDRLSNTIDVNKNQQIISQLHHANIQVKYLKEELQKTRNMMNNLRSKCQLLGEQYEGTFYTLRKMEALRAQTIFSQQKPSVDLSRAREQLIAVVRENEILKKENEELNSLLETMRNQLKWEENRLNEENLQYEKNVEFLKQQLQKRTTEVTQLRKYQAIVHACLQQQRASTLTTCAQEIHQQLMPPHKLSEVGLLVDGGKSLDTADFSMIEQKDEGVSQQKQHLQQSGLKEKSLKPEYDSDKSAREQGREASLGSTHLVEAEICESEGEGSEGAKYGEECTESGANQ